MMSKLPGCFFCIIVVLVGFLWGEDSSNFTIGPLPPINISLDAPIQIDELNTNTQNTIVANSPDRLNQILKKKRFPSELLLIAVVLGIGYFIVKNISPPKKQAELPPLTPAIRIKQAEQILANADEDLSDGQALSLFHLLDPIADSLSDPIPYYHLSERVKFAAYPPKKSEILSVLIDKLPTINAGDVNDK